MSLRVVQIEYDFFVQKKEGIFFKKWEYLNEYGIPLDYNHEPEDATPIKFSDPESAIEFMEGVAYPASQAPLQVIAWIGDKE